MNIPVLYYHSIANSNNRVWGFLSVPITTFTLQLRLLKFLGYYTCNWEELYQHVQGTKKLPKKTAMLHFDDGFLDNWTVVFSLLKKYNMKASIVVSEDFIEKRKITRPFVTSTTETNLENWWGYLSEDELKEMENSGLVDIQAHGKTHTWYESEPVLEDVYDGTQILPHLYWNGNDSKKHNWLKGDLNKVISKGYPVLKYKKSLELERRFMVNPDFIKKSIETYEPKKTKVQNFDAIQDLLKSYVNNGTIGRYETDDEKNKRLESELLGNKQYLEKVLGKKVDYLVYPGGGKMDEVLALSKKFGYKLVSQGGDLNGFNSGVFRVSRLSATYPFSNNVLYSFLNLIFFFFQLKRGGGNKVIGYFSKIFRKKLGYA